MWHLQHGVLRDASILQSLMLLAAQDGNAAVLNLLMPLFNQHGWLVSVFKRFVRSIPIISVHNARAKQT